MTTRQKMHRQSTPTNCSPSFSSSFFVSTLPERPPSFTFPAAAAALSSSSSTSSSSSSFAHFHPATLLRPICYSTGQAPSPSFTNQPEARSSYIHYLPTNNSSGLRPLNHDLCIHSHQSTDSPSKRSSTQLQRTSNASKYHSRTSSIASSSFNSTQVSVSLDFRKSTNSAITTKPTFTKRWSAGIFGSQAKQQPVTKSFVPSIAEVRSPPSRFASNRTSLSLSPSRDNLRSYSSNASTVTPDSVKKQASCSHLDTRRQVSYQTSDRDPGTIKPFAYCSAKPELPRANFDFGFENIISSPPTQQETSATSEVQQTQALDESSIIQTDEMGLMRHLTTRVRRSDIMPASSLAAKARPIISLPVNLISTTNMLSYNAPDVADMQQQYSSDISVASSRASQHSSIDGSTVSEPGLTDASSVSSDSMPGSPMDKSSRMEYFPEHSSASTSETSLPQLSSTQDDMIVASAPAIPRRAPSHSKREHVRLARHRSLQHGHNRSLSVVSTSFLASSGDSDSPLSPTATSPAHPFSQELEQLSEAVEDFGGEAECEDDVRVMEDKGLVSWRASAYMAEIEDLSEGLWDRRFSFESAREDWV